MRTVIFLALMVMVANRITAQETDTIRIAPLHEKTPSYSCFIFSAASITYGVVAKFNNGLHQLDLNVNNEVSKSFKHRTHAEDYLQVAPLITVYGLDIIGVKAKHHFGERMFLTTSSYMIMLVSVRTLKKNTSIQRPDESDYLAFPSGHTATAFVGAHLLYKEYKDISPWIGFAGYAVSGYTGIMRVVNKRHWVSDVVTGAGIGVLSVEISYLLLPIFQNIVGIKDHDKSLIATPVIGRDHFGFGLAYSF